MFLNLCYRYRRFHCIFLCLFLSIVDKALNGSNFIHVRLRYQRNGFQRLGESVRTVASSILRRTGMSLDGNEIYIRPVQSESKEKGTIIFETLVLNGLI